MSIRVTHFGSQPFLASRNWLWGYFFVPESSRAISEKLLNYAAFIQLGRSHLLRSHHEIFGAPYRSSLLIFSHNVFSVWVLYAIHRYSWSQGMIGISLMIVGIVTAVILQA